MKKMLIAFISALITVVIILIGFTVLGRDLRRQELKNALKSSMESAMELLLAEEGGPETEEEWRAMFVQSVALQIESTSQLRVVIVESDMEKGYLKAEAVLTWRHPIGTIGSVSEVMDIMLEEYVIESKE